jgi:flagellar P-ring protein precursor FlgI
MTRLLLPNHMAGKIFVTMLLFACTFCFSIIPAGATRLKDLADIKGVRKNQLVGYGLVVGLDGTGDGKDAKFTFQSLASLLERMGVTVDPKKIQKVANVAAVMVTADLPAFAKVGVQMDITVSSVGNASSLTGGVLLVTPLRAANGKVYAAAQGPVITGGFSVSGSAAKVTKNFPTVGRIVAGATIERESPMISWIKGPCRSFCPTLILPMHPE